MIRMSLGFLMNAQMATATHPNLPDVPIHYSGFVNLLRLMLNR